MIYQLYYSHQWADVRRFWHLYEFDAADKRFDWLEKENERYKICEAYYDEQESTRVVPYRFNGLVDCRVYSGELPILAITAVRSCDG